MLNHLLDEKSFDQLTPDERKVALHEFGSEEQYTLARKIGLALVRQKTGLSPDPWILASLHDHMVTRRSPSRWASFFQAQVPAYVVVCASLAMAVAVWWLKPEPPAPAQIVHVVRDTIYQAAIPDTVYRDKLIYRYRYRYRYITAAASQPVGNITTAATPASLVSEGVTMKDKEELEKLLVSGSD